MDAVWTVQYILPKNQDNSTSKFWSIICLHPAVIMLLEKMLYSIWRTVTQLMSLSWCITDFQPFHTGEQLIFFKVKVGFLYCKFKPTENGLLALNYIFYKYCWFSAKSPQTIRLKLLVYTNRMFLPLLDGCHLWLAVYGCLTAICVSVCSINGCGKECGNQ